MREKPLAGIIDELSPWIGKVECLGPFAKWGYGMPNEHGPTLQGRIFLWGGVGFGLLFLAIFLTRGFGLLGGPEKRAEGPELMIRRGNQILVPEGSALRNQLSVVPAEAQAVSARLVLPGIVESDPARTAAVLTPLSGRVIALNVALGERVEQGLLAPRPDAFDLVEGVLLHLGAALGAVGADGEAVGFVAQALEVVEDRTFEVETERFAALHIEMFAACIPVRAFGDADEHLKRLSERDGLFG